MTELNIEKIQNLEHPDVKNLLNQFKNRHEMNVVDVAEIISKLISTLKLDYNAGRPKLYAISGEHLGQILGVGKGVISQYMSVWNMPQESRDFLRNYSLSLINAYYVSRGKGKDEVETIKIQKQLIQDKNINPSTNGQKTDILIHAINETKMVLGGITTSYKIPPEIFKIINISDQDLRKYDVVLEKSKMYIYNINQCINYLSPKISKLSYLRKEMEFCNIMLENKICSFCGKEITPECLNKQINSILGEICLIEAEYKLPHIASLIMMKQNLEKNI